MADGRLTALIEALRLALPQADSGTLRQIGEALLQGQQPAVGTSTAALSFGQDNTFQDATISIGDIAGSNTTKVDVHLPQPLDPLPAALTLLAALPIDQLPPPTPTLPAASRMPLGRNAQFVGRTADLLRIAQVLAAPPAGVIATVVATGLGGMGKTSLAVEVAYRYGRYFQGGVCWIACADPGAIPADVAACAASLGLASAGQGSTIRARPSAGPGRSPCPAC